MFIVMTADAVVTKLMPHGTAEVAVIRMTACGGKCDSCEACKCDSEVRVVASNPLGAKPGQRVVIESRSSEVFGAALLVYILPILLLLAGYIAGAALELSEGLCILLAFAATGLGTVITFIFLRGKKKISYNIIKLS